METTKGIKKHVYMHTLTHGGSVDGLTVGTVINIDISSMVLHYLNTTEKKANKVSIQ